jgi:predicted CxxxxCH...CXXCH cytochrome family protein
MSPIIKNIESAKRRVSGSMDDGRSFASLTMTKDAKIFSSLVLRPSFFVLLLTIMLFLAGCSRSNKNAVFDADSGKHPENWYTAHRATYKADPNVCYECHGTDLKGGKSAISCFSASVDGLSCHAIGPLGHAAGWGDPANHGAAAKAAANPVTPSGLSICQACHGADFSGGDADQSCFTCHGANAPHAVPWLTGTYTHTTADPSNAVTCAQCHANGQNSPIAAPTPAAPAGTAPGCFNATLCHAQVGHPSGWQAPAAHGAAAKAAPDQAAGTGFTTCQECHATDFSGGIAGQSCFTCHGVAAPHAVPWISGTRTHTTTDPLNATACAQCHANGNNSPIQPSPAAPAGTAPGCFNATLCHSSHPSGWASAAKHGTAAKAAPDQAAGTGFSTCQACHSADFSGGIANQSCFTCHNPGVNVPHAPAPWRVLAGQTGSVTHVNADLNNASVCSLCHTNGANSTLQPLSPASSGTAAGCFNSTLCHAVPNNCTYCHTKPPSGTAAPNRAGAHTVHYASVTLTDGCNTCHNNAGAGTALHNNGTVEVQFLSAYNAKSGTASRNADGTCSKVSCHGGQTTPVWLTGSIDVNTQCTSCHSYGTTEYNSFSSGQHDHHVNDEGFACTVCHDTTKLAVGHFANLNTSVLEGPASATTVNAINYNATAKTCNPGSGGLTGCHGQLSWP